MLKRFIQRTLMAAALCAAAPTMAADITGAGATFPYPIYAKWAEAYKKETGIGLNYQSIGSSGGIKQIRAKTVTFGASDAPVKGEDLDRDGMIQFPAVIGGTVPVFNLDGFKPGDLRITGPVLAEVFMGSITQWNDPKLAALNPGKALPNLAITIVHRADGSGTTFNFTEYLTMVSPDWKAKVGTGAAVKWPAASSVGGKGGIGYVEYAYAKRNNMPYMAMQNRDGQYVRPDDLTFAAAAAGADWFAAPGMGISINNQPGANSWPISTASFILMYKSPSDKKASDEVLKFFDWSFKNGKQLALDLDYVPLPDSLTAQIRSKVWSQIK
jgi:phosphate transport system substrate-binding protein